VLTTESQMGAQDAQMTVRQTGSALAGTITGQAGSVDYQGTVNGAAVAFDFVITVQGTELKLDYTGTVEGDTMKGKAVFGQFGEGTFTAKRQ
jgi:predicted lipoprotein